MEAGIFWTWEMGISWSLCGSSIVIHVFWVICRISTHQGVSVGIWARLGMLTNDECLAVEPSVAAEGVGKDWAVSHGVVGDQQINLSILMNCCVKCWILPLTGHFHRVMDYQIWGYPILSKAYQTKPFRKVGASGSQKNCAMLWLWLGIFLLLPFGLQPALTKEKRPYINRRRLWSFLSHYLAT